jgi:hypothetical protein
MVTQHLLRIGVAAVVFAVVMLVAGEHQSAFAQFYYYRSSPPAGYSYSSILPSAPQPSTVMPSTVMPGYVPVYRGVWPAVILFAPASYVAIPWSAGPVIYVYRRY